MLEKSTAISTEQKGPFFSNQKVAPHLKATMDVSALHGEVPTPTLSKACLTVHLTREHCDEPIFQIRITFLPLYLNYFTSSVHP